MTFSLLENIPSLGCCLAALVALCCAAAASSEPLFKGSESIPADAIVLFDGKDLSKFTMCGSDKAPTWIVENGYAIPRDGDICSKQLFKDCQLHVEFWLPLMPDATGQARANSGVFFMGFVYEIQILDSYGLDPTEYDCGAMYSIKKPDVNAARPPETWQTYDAIFHAPRFDESGKKIANARITLFWNGVMVHDNFEIPSPTPDHNAPEPKEPGPIRLQWHGNDVRFRNVWVRPL